MYEWRSNPKTDGGSVVRKRSQIPLTPAKGFGADVCTDQLAEVLFSEVSMDVLQMTGNDHTEQTADPLELAEIKRRWNPFLERLPEYQTVCEKILAGEK